MVKNKLVSRSELATLAGVSPSAITRMCKPGKPLHGAVVGRKVDAAHPSVVSYVAQKRTNVADGPDPLYDSAVEACIDAGRWTAHFLETHFEIKTHRAKKLVAAMKSAGLDMSAPKAPEVTGNAVTKNRKKSTPPPEAPGNYETFEVPEHILSFAEWTVREVIEKFGTDQRFVDFLKAIQVIEAINEKRIKSAEKKGDLVSRQMVKVGVIDKIDAAHIRLLQDGAKSITVAVISKHDAGINPAVIEEYVGELLGSFIRPLKNQISRALRRG